MDFRQAFGIVFCGPPGVFAVWEQTPDGFLLDHEAAERLGQVAVRAGAADYRIFPIEPDPDLPFLAGSSPSAEALIQEGEGVPC